MTPSKRYPIVLALLGLLLVVGFFAWQSYRVETLRGDVNRQARALVATRGAREALASDVVALREQVISNGETPVAPPPAVVPDAIPGLTPSDVRSIATDVVSAYAVDNATVSALVDASVAQVRPANPTQSQVVNATRSVVAAYLSDNPPPAGAPGTDGTSGAPGTAGADGVPGVDGVAGTSGVDGLTGPAGPPGVGVASAVFDPVSCSVVQTLTDGTTATFGPLCGTDGTNGLDGKDGKDGLDGKDGTNGTDGVGITSVACAGSGPLARAEFTITYTNGHTQVVACTDPAPTP